MWQARKDLPENFNNIQMALKTMFECIIDPACHSSGMGRTGFGTYKSLATLQRIQTLYSKPILGYLDASLLRLNDPMDRNQPVEVMIWAIEDVRLFLRVKNVAIRRRRNKARPRKLWGGIPYHGRDRQKFLIGGKDSSICRTGNSRQEQN